MLWSVWPHVACSSRLPSCPPAVRPLGASVLLVASDGVPGVEPQFVAETLPLRVRKNNRMLVERVVAHGDGCADMVSYTKSPCDRVCTFATRLLCVTARSDALERLAACLSIYVYVYSYVYIYLYIYIYIYIYI